MGIAGVMVYNHLLNKYLQLSSLGQYEPPTVTVVYDRNNEVLGEIYKHRRYVTKNFDMPPHLIEAFLAAEDANFYEHSGIDYFGIVRAVLRNALKGKKAQGASTITQQVAKTFCCLLKRPIRVRSKKSL